MSGNSMILKAKAKIEIWEINADGKRKKVGKINFHYSEKKFPEGKGLLNWVKKEIAPDFKKKYICKKVDVYVQQDSNFIQWAKNKINAQSGMEVLKKTVIIIEIVF